MGEQGERRRERVSDVFADCGRRRRRRRSGLTWK
jgi:hypothetical protein